MPKNEKPWAQRRQGRIAFEQTDSPLALFFVVAISRADNALNQSTSLQLYHRAERGAAPKKALIVARDFRDFQHQYGTAPGAREFAAVHHVHGSGITLAAGHRRIGSIRQRIGWGERGNYPPGGGGSRFKGGAAVVANVVKATIRSACVEYFRRGADGAANLQLAALHRYLAGAAGGGVGGPKKSGSSTTVDCFSRAVIASCAIWGATRFSTSGFTSSNVLVSRDSTLIRW